jgi:hypothetical protein
MGRSELEALQLKINSEKINYQHRNSKVSSISKYIN